MVRFVFTLDFRLTVGFAERLAVPRLDAFFALAGGRPSGIGVSPNGRFAADSSFGINALILFDASASVFTGLILYPARALTTPPMTTRSPAWRTAHSRCSTWDFRRSEAGRFGLNALFGGLGTLMSA